MRAHVLEQFDGPFIAKDVPTPVIAPHEALVRVTHVGVCGTDVKIRGNRMGIGVIPLIMGHEIAGRVAEVGSAVRGFVPGDRVVVNFYVTCGRCTFCRNGRDTLCAEVRQHGFSLDGGFAEYVVTPGVNLCKVPDNVSLEQACILGDAVATSYHAITRRAHVRPGTTLAIVGVGGVGLHALQIARLAGAFVIAVDVSEARLDLARKLGADAEDAFDALRQGRPLGRNVLAIRDAGTAHAVMPTPPRPSLAGTSDGAAEPVGSNRRMPCPSP